MKHLDDFKSYLENEKRYSPNTVSNYLGAVKSLGMFLGHSDPFAIKQKDIRNWVARMKDTGKDNESVRTSVFSTKPFFKFLMRRHKLEKDPFVGVPIPKKRRKLPKFVTDTQISELLDGDFYPVTWKGVRDRFVIHLLYSTGMRASELIALKIQDVNTREGYIKVSGKGNKEREIPIIPELAQSFDRYMEERSKRKNVFHKYLIITDLGRKAYSRFIDNICNDGLEYLGVEGRGAHIFRHSIATHFLDNGMPLNGIQKFLGHESVGTTQIYTHLSTAKNVQIHNAIFNR